MTTDRELIELAAKAAGIVGCWKEKADAGWGGKICGFFLPSGRQGGNGRRWNPLDNDGDALRLAVKLKMRVSVGQVDWVGNEYGGAFAELGEIETDPYAATRRAIVRAAAEVQP